MQESTKEILQEIRKIRDEFRVVKESIDAIIQNTAEAMAHSQELMQEIAMRQQISDRNKQLMLRLRGRFSAHRDQRKP